MDEAYKWANRLKDGPLYALGVTKELFEYEANINLETPLEMKRRPGKVYGDAGLHRGLQRIR